MAKALTKSEIAAHLAEKNNISKKQAVEILEHVRPRFVELSFNAIAARTGHIAFLPFV